MTEQDFEILLAVGHESNGVEFKGPGARTDPSFFAKVVRAVLGMANRRGGGDVFVGVEESTNLEPVGLNDSDLEIWRDYDVLVESINGYADPNLTFDLKVLDYRGRKIVALDIDEFSEIPILCTKDYQDPSKKAPTLRRGACYVRSRHKPETSEVPSAEEMRELLELAIDKGVAKYVARAQKAGMFPTFQPAPVSPSDDELFRRQIEEIG